MLIYANSMVIEESTKAVQASNKKITEVVNKVLLLQFRVKEFMANLRASADKIRTDMNMVIKAFGSSLKAEREDLSKIRGDIKLDNVDQNSTITTQLDNLKPNMVAENKIMDALAEQTQKAKVLTENLKHAKLEVDKLQEEKISIKAFYSEIHQRLLIIVETRSHPFNDTRGGKSGHRVLFLSKTTRHDTTRSQLDGYRDRLNSEQKTNSEAFKEPKDIQDFPRGLIDKEYWSIVYKKNEDGVLKNHMFFLRNKHLYSTSTMNQILTRA
ncbi:unnamed protein product [Lactuca saligna]|uniref:Uncharacterized protein n=1 Tax=Lactuca saligna TaxID=75948 RepID=A0AA35ZAA2_LACSI|nr:unnamed protein product [Lactuca saligna]